ncbi:MAG: molybdenum cofactor guanylyltransferase [Bryobacter sp.]|nr:molybdenum cofactor guanylyltransferase [Bryobacter sp.]
MRLGSKRKTGGQADLTGWLLAGGASRRMGRDKALLPWQGETLLENRAKLLAEVCGEVKILAPVGKYRAWGWESLPDQQAGLGPLGGIATALAESKTEWNLVLAVDLPFVTVEWLEELWAARDEACDAVVSDSPTRGVQPLCALWRRRARGAVEAALVEKELRVRALVEKLRVKRVVCVDVEMLRNWNEPGDIQFGEAKEGRRTGE